MSPEQHLDRVSEEINTKLTDMVYSYDTKVLTGALLYFSNMLVNNLVSGGILTEAQALQLIKETYQNVTVKRVVRTVVLDPSKKELAS